MIVLGIAIAVAGWLDTEAKAAVKARRWLAGGLEQLGAKIPSSAIARSMAERADLWRTIAGAIGVIFLIAGDVLSVWHVIWTVLATAGLFAGIQLLIGSNEEIVEVEETVAVVD
jgi:hypothetical protein